MTPGGLAMETEYAIPENSGDVLIVPPLEEISGLLAEGWTRAWGDTAILDVPLAEFRRRVRARALALAARYTGGAEPPPERPLILMGHQPLFFHPGVWFKFFLLTRLSAECHATGLHLIVDTDASGPISAVLPAVRERMIRVSETLLDSPDDEPLEAARVPAPEEWDRFLERVRGHLATVPLRVLAERLDAFARGAEAARRGARTLAVFLARLRRTYEARAGSPGYLELPVSALAETSEFRAFALHLLCHPQDLRRSYNASLEEYRRAHRLRSAANPFPNLTEGGGSVETPFWVVRGGRRTDLFATRREHHLALGTAAETLATVPADPSGLDALEAAGLALRPKAMMLTMFARLCLGDLFLHGVSGGRYDRVTDVIADRVFGCRLPAYVVATATLHLPLAEEAQAAAARHAIEHRLMDLRHNPDRNMDALSDAQRRLVDEKWTLIRAIEGMRPGSDRRAATRRIREVNAQLAEALAPEIARLEARRAALERQGDAEDVARYRGYPFFLFDPAEVGALVGAPLRPA
ncbi:MAG TPA: hypothetical protein VFW01_07090 [bacterium]|nr:hypothetical protein [bacterium]